MEIAIVNGNSLKIKGKKVSIAVDTADKINTPAVILLNLPQDKLSAKNPETLFIYGPGEYEVGGAKISGLRSAGGMVYTIFVDGIGILLGSITSLEKLQHKLNEHNIVISYADIMANSSFVTSLASNAVIFYGSHSKDLAASFGKGSSQATDKYVTTLDKLPQEVETIILE